MAGGIPRTWALVPRLLGAPGMSRSLLALLLLLPSLAVAQPSPSPSPSPPAPVTRVRAVKNGWIAIESTEALHVGDRFEVRSQERVMVADPMTDEERAEIVSEPRGVFAVERLDGSVGLGRLPRGLIARVGDLVVRTSAPVRETLAAPAMWRSMTRVQAIARPLLAIDHLGGGALSTLSVSRYFQPPLRAGIELAPVGLLIERTRPEQGYGTQGGTGVVGELRAFLAYSTDFFEVGLGMGPEFAAQNTTRLSLAPMVRLGSLDGLRLVVTNAYSYEDRDNDPRFRFGSLTVEIGIPLNHQLTLDLQGGGSSRWGFGALALDTYLRGTGGPGTLILHTGVGAASIRDDGVVCDYSTGTTCRGNEVRGWGPTIAIGFDARY